MRVSSFCWRSRTEHGVVALLLSCLALLLVGRDVDSSAFVPAVFFFLFLFFFFFRRPPVNEWLSTFTPTRCDGTNDGAAAGAAARAANGSGA